MNKEMLVTVITPCYNSAETIQRTLDSVRQQTYPNIEYIIVDGGSKDGTLEIIEKNKGLFSGKVTVLSEPDKGIYDAMNKGIRMASGELIGIVNSDDYYEQDAVEKMAEAAKDVPYQILYGFERTLQDGREASIVFHHHSNLKNQMITHPTCFVSRKLYEDFGTFSMEYRYSADYEFMLRMAENPKVEFVPVYSLISNYALGGASGTADAYLETQRLMYEHGWISAKKYKLIRFKCFLGKKLSRFVKW